MSCDVIISNMSRFINICLRTKSSFLNETLYNRFLTPQFGHTYPYPSVRVSRSSSQEKILVVSTKVDQDDLLELYFIDEALKEYIAPPPPPRCRLSSSFDPSFVVELSGGSSTPSAAFV